MALVELEEVAAEKEVSAKTAAGWKMSDKWQKMDT